ncbi:glycoside hydrolase family 3 N-terminal domain-containing protein [Ktedonobacter racemifer]|uniref:Glycoside hydrolase family 3 domain protein n=1 Tax=Ktedonobacter racemifer DSM 44963 TaxID=485913 RepID=D6TR04_KTERA|nr:glycoside hydrolase family 3 N-terminal domain-containing protein [Ktedonobacter racemifer]EFH85875.1 glycoside hydrolase family 3 domain protein [Ktedonobacter racemifer DSM 44963]
MSTPSYRDPHASLEERVEHLLSLMTLDEKLAQLGCLWSTSFVRAGTFDPEEVARQIPHGIGQVTRIGAATGLHPRESAAFMNAIQKVALERTRLGIPVIVHEEATGGFCHRDATVFPQGLGLAATWNPALVTEVAGVIRAQMLAVGARHALAPVLDVARDPRWGRVEETYGEDPVLIGALGSAYVRGLQSDDLRQGVAATGKHFLGYAMSDGGRNWGPVQLGPRELREVYAEPFAAVIRNTGLATVMNSYASVDGLPCTGSPAILTGLLREELGFGGVVVADYDAVTQLMNYHRVAATRGEAGRLALLAGLDMELPTLDCYGEPLKAEIEAGRLAREVVDMAVRRVLHLKFQLGLFEQPYVDDAVAHAIFQTPEQRTLARRAVAESTILLTNDGVLPLAPTIKRIAVIGPGADDERLLQGDYHYPAHQEILYQAAQDVEIAGLATPQTAGNYAPGPYFTPHVTPLAGLRAALPDVEISYARGCEVLGNDTSGFEDALRIVREADIIVAVVAGKSGLLRPVTVGEGNDSTSLDLTGMQPELINLLAGTGTPLVVAVLSGRVHTLASVASQANALLQLFPAGEEGGHGLADVLTGKVNPAGRLPVTLPRSVGQVPIFAGQRAGADRIPLFGDYIDSPPTPLFPFGHGLSYTTFAYGDLSIHATDITGPIAISIEVENTGKFAGDEVVQLYGRDDVASVARPDRLLLGFARISLAPGECRQVTFTVHPSRLAFYDPYMRFVTEPGAFTFSVGASSADIRAESTLILDGPLIEYKQREVVNTTVRIL